MHSLPLDFASKAYLQRGRALRAILRSLRRRQPLDRSLPQGTCVVTVDGMKVVRPIPFDRRRVPDADNMAAPTGILIAFWIGIGIWALIRSVVAWL